MCVVSKQVCLVSLRGVMCVCVCVCVCADADVFGVFQE